MTYTKHDLMVMVAAGRLIETFDHFDTSGLHRRFHISAMRKVITTEPDRWRRCLTPITLDLLQHIASSREVCPDRLARLTPEELEDPAILIACRGGTHLMVDGHHRVVRRALRGDQEFWFYEVPESEAILIDPDDPKFIQRHRWGSLDPTDRGMVPRSNP